MPIYEYNCGGCGKIEVTQKITEKPLSNCPTCGKKVKKLISNTSFQLKGTGWYLTDYARKGKGNGTDTNKPSKSSESGEKADNKSTTKASDTKSSDNKTTSEKSSESSAS